MSKFFFLLFFFSIYCSEKIDKPKNNERNLDSNEYSNIRLYIDSKCLSSNITSNNIFQRSINKAQKTIENLIKVKRIEQDIYLDRDFQIKSHLDSKFTGCIDEEVIKKSLQADLIIFIRNYDSDLDNDKTMDFGLSSIIKYVEDNPKKRPFIGMVIYDNRFKLDTFTDDESRVQIISTIFLHEFTHILGFNKAILKNHYITYTETVKNRMNNVMKEKLFVNGTKTLEIAKKYFGCTELKGVELDDFSGNEVKDGNSIHWSERILLGDYMIAELYPMDQAISEITLALLEDLGDWYKVNYYTGGLMRFGKNKGCNFLKDDCVKQKNHPFLESTFPSEFCSNDPLGDAFEMCSTGRQSMTYCSNLFTYGYVSSDYKRISIKSNSFGFGPSELIEYCPYANSDTHNEKKYNYFGNCKIGNGNFGHDLTSVVEEYDGTSFCAFSSLVDKSYTNRPNVIGVIFPHCYKMSCSEKSLTIHISDEFIVCPREGGVIKIDSTYSKYKGILFCPDYNLICTSTEVCNNLFDCAEKNSTVKNSSFIYDYNVSEYVSIDIKSFNESSITDFVSENIYELGEDGICPQFCQQCTSNKQCAICRPNFIHYIGTKENDDQEIKCSEHPPAEGYYHKYDYENNKHFYYKCIDNCITCSNANECEQCNRTYFVNSTNKQCQERIPGCTKYDETKPVKTADNGGNYSYLECLNCNGSADYYCLNENKSICNLIPNINMSIYAPLPRLGYDCYKKKM